MSKPLVVIISGPTASGKTGLSIEIAKRFNGEIVSADSMQIYKSMDIATAKPTKWSATKDSQAKNTNANTDFFRSNLQPTPKRPFPLTGSQTTAPTFPTNM